MKRYYQLTGKEEPVNGSSCVTVLCPFHGHKTNKQETCVIDAISQAFLCTVCGSMGKADYAESYGVKLWGLNT